MRTKTKRLLPVVCVAIPLAVGGLAAWLARDGIERFAAMAKPPLTPPDWVFPAVWTVLYVLMGLASWLVVTADAPDAEVSRALLLYEIQLILNFFWPLFFFNLSAYLFSFVLLTVLWLFLLATAARFARLSRTAGWLLLPYILWVAFAGALNLSVYLLNR